MILLLDNYDSFSYNLYQLVASIRDDLKVVRNDKITIDEIKNSNFDAIFFSPGPGRPEDAGIMVEAISYFKGKIPMFGVCLGHQAICVSYGAEVSYAKKLMHGKSSLIKYNADSVLFKGLANPFKAARYHSLSLVENTLKEGTLKITAKSDDGEIMAVEDVQNKVFGVQFHPESVLTPDGKIIIENFLSFIK